MRDENVCVRKCQVGETLGGGEIWLLGSAERQVVKRITGAVPT